MPADDLFDASGEAATPDAEERPVGNEIRGGRKSSTGPAASPSPVHLDVEGVPLDAKKGKARTETVKRGACPRWMFHRKGVYCKECGKVGT